MSAKVGLWCADNTIRFLDGERWGDIDVPQNLLCHAMTGGKTQVYVSDPDVLERFVAHVVHAMPHNEHRASLSWDGIVSKKGRFFSFSVQIDKDNVIKFFEISNLLRDGYRMILDKTKSLDMQLLDILRMYDSHGLCAITAGGASMSAYAGGAWSWYYGKFPQLKPETKKLLHDGYIGGLMLNHEGRYGKSIDIDCNSMYPSILRDEFLPYGTPEEYAGKYEEDRDMPLHCDELTFRAELKHGGYPFLADNRGFDGNARLESTHGYITKTLTDIDQKLLFENYDVSVYRYVRGWKFRQSKGFFQSFIDDWGAMKQRETGNKRQMAKLIMNALVGKMASLPKGAVLLPTSQDGVTLDWIVGRRDESNLKTDYLPIPMWVNAYARRKLIDVCRANADRLIYANTDGCILSGWETPAHCDIHSVELGKWKIAAKYDRLTILGMNRYQGWRDDGGVDVCMAGNLFSEPIPYDQFRHGVQVTDDYGTTVTL